VLKTTARLDGDHFLVNGNKLWTSGAEAADYIWLAARTDPDLPRHKGISILILDTQEAGFSHTLIPTCSNPTAATYYDNVRVPADMLVGKLNGGWQLVTSQLNHERLGLGAWSDKVVGLFRRVLLWAKARDESGRRAVDSPWVRSQLAECYARLEAMRLINFRIAADLEHGRMDVALASSTKVYGSSRPSRSCASSRRSSAPVRLVRRFGGGDGCSASWNTRLRLGDPHLRRRHQRDPARTDRPVWPGHAPGHQRGHKDDAMSTIDEFRKEVRAWLEANCPPAIRTPTPDRALIFGAARSASSPRTSACGSSACATAAGSPRTGRPPMVVAA
jgi:hypothetical protein